MAKKRRKETIRKQYDRVYSRAIAAGAEPAGLASFATFKHRTLRRSRGKSPLY